MKELIVKILKEETSVEYNFDERLIGSVVNSENFNSSFIKILFYKYDIDLSSEIRKYDTMVMINTKITLTPKNSEKNILEYSTSWQYIPQSGLHLDVTYSFNLDMIPFLKTTSSEQTFTDFMVKLSREIAKQTLSKYTFKTIPTEKLVKVLDRALTRIYGELSLIDAGSRFNYDYKYRIVSPNLNNVLYITNENMMDYTSDIRNDILKLVPINKYEFDSLLHDWAEYKFNIDLSTN